MSKQRASRKVTSTEARIVEAVTPDPDAPIAALIGRVGKLGDQPELRILSGGVIAAGLLTSNGRLARAGLRMLIAHELATALKDVIKRRIDRTRPRSASSHPQRKVKLGKSTAKEETSFPSGHSAGSVAVARAFSREYPQFQGPALAAAGTVAIAQVPRCAHYPTDVAAGIALGAVSEALSAFVFGKVEEAITPEEQPLPPLPA